MEDRDFELEAGMAMLKIRSSVRMALNAHPLDITRICALAGVSRSSVYAFMTGQRDIRLETLLRLQAYLHQAPLSRGLENTDSRTMTSSDHESPAKTTEDSVADSRSSTHKGTSA
jgi:predicted transcriptional regulator